MSGIDLSRIQQAAAAGAQQEQMMRVLLVQTAATICGGVLGAEYKFAKHQAASKMETFPGEAEEDQDGNKQMQFQVDLRAPIGMSMTAARALLVEAGLMRQGPETDNQKKEDACPSCQ